MKFKFLTIDEAVLDMIWTHPNVQQIHSETIKDEEFDDVYVTYEVFQYPKDDVCEDEEQEPIFIFTKRGCIRTRHQMYRTKKGAYRKLEKEKAKYHEDVENFRTLSVIGKVARRGK